jgi:UDP-N-acetylmuramyl pentapeptide phosphotransferase/UDP-N-acetylglucosamine-1-phosphate transferase
MNTYYRPLPRRQHPALLGLAILFAFAAVAAFWPPFFALAIVVAGFCCALLVALWVYDRGRQAIYDYRRELLARAEYEHWLWMRGDPRGFYGRYPPAV